MRKQTPTESNAAAAIRAIDEKIAGWNAELKEELNDVITLEGAGVVAINPSHAAYDVDAAARARLNGASYVAAPIGNKPGVELFLKRRKVEELKRAIELASQQSGAARIDLGRELLAKYDPEIRALHRERALAIVKIFKLNAELEAMRLKLLQAGSSVPHEMDGFNLKLFGQSHPPTPMNEWPRRYLQTCLKAKIITEKDLEQ